VEQKDDGDPAAEPDPEDVERTGRVDLVKGGEQDRVGEYLADGEQRSFRDREAGADQGPLEAVRPHPGIAGEDQPRRPDRGRQHRERPAILHQFTRRPMGRPDHQRQQLVGAHVSTRGGVHLAPSRGKAIGATAIQVFTKTPNQWRDPEISHATSVQSSIASMVSAVTKDSYLINITSPSPR
jgi:hypothetical protein